MDQQNSKRLAVIPARGGSKRLPGKNVKLLSGKPLIAWSIQVAEKTGFFDRIVVSTDDPEIAEIARNYHAEVPFMRSPELARDHSSPVDAALDMLDRLDEDFDTLTWLQPTSPLRTAEDICNAFSIYSDNAADAVISVCPCEHSPLWTGIIERDGNMRNFLQNENLRKLSQQLPTHHRVNGAIFIVATNLLRKHKSFYVHGDKTFAYQMTPEHSVDIDTQFDFDLANLLLDKRKS